MAIQSVNPVTGKTLKTYNALTPVELEAKLNLAAAAFHSLRKTPFPFRAAHMMRAAEILEARKEHWGRIMTLEMGKPLQSAIDEVVKCAWVCRYYAQNAESFLAEERVETGAKHSSIHYQPLGPVLAIMPWNFPFWQVFRFAAPALMAGNVGLLKHASNVPQSALAIEQIFHDAGFAPGLLQTLLIPAAQVGPLLADPRIVAATLTGSERAGCEVGLSAAKHIKKIVLELGGSDPFIVMPSADLDAAVTTAVKARCINNGQSCIAAKRFIVHDSIAEKFQHEFVRQMAALKIGDPLEPETEIGPLVNRDAAIELEHAVSASVASGAKLLLGGKAISGPGAFFPPTVLSNIPEDSPAYREELFGPVACLFRAANPQDALRIANDTRFGLGASLWSRDPDEQQFFIDGLDAGMVYVNKMVISDPRLPFGGVKRSGIGREMAAHGIRAFTNIKTVCIE